MVILFSAVVLFCSVPISVFRKNLQNFYTDASVIKGIFMNISLIVLHVDITRFI